MFVRLKKGLLTTILLIVLGVCLLLSPWGLTKLSNYLGQPYLLSVDRVSLTLRPFGLQLHDIVLGKGDSALTLTQLDLRLNPAALWGEVAEFTVVGDRLRVGYQGNDPMVAGLTLLQWQKQLKLDADTSTQAPSNSLSSTASSEEKSDALPALIIPSIRFAEINLQSERAGWPNVVIKNIQMGAISTEATEQAASLKASINTGKGDFLLSGYFYPLAQQHSGEFDIEVKHFQPTNRWLKFVPAALNSVNVNAKLKAAWKQNKSSPLPKFHLQGDINLNALHWKTLGQDLQLAALELNGLVLDERSIRLSDLDLQKLALKLDGNPNTAIQYQLEQLTLSEFILHHWLQPEHFELDLVQLDLTGQRFQQASTDLLLQKLALSSVVITPSQLALSQVLGQQIALQLHGKTTDLASGASPLTNQYLLQHFELKGLELVDWQSRPQIKLKQAVIVDGELNWQKEEIAVSKAIPTAEASKSEVKNEMLDAGSVNEVSANEEPEKAREHLSVQVQQLNIQRQKVLYQDHNLLKPTQSEFLLESMTLNDFEWPSDKTAHWTLDAWLDGQSHWLLAGSLQPEPLVFTATGSQKGLALPSISPYAEQVAQVYFLQGVMDNQIKLDFEQDHLKGEIGFLFHQLDMSLKGEFASQNLPLQMALSILEDSDDRIELNISIDKKGDELKVGSADVIREFILSASQKGALSYLKYTLQPFASLMTLKSLGESLLEGGAIPLEPVEFELLQAELNAQQKAYADKIGVILKERTALKLTSCLRSNQAEYQLLLEQNKGDVKLSQKAFLTLEQGRLRQWRRIMASKGVASQLKACELPRKELSSQDANGPAMLVLKLAP
ncbi:protein of unknown function [Oceanospirillum multiglobuliferum]|uniref:DUF748 domain-containing protein n=1 Tax=Oceanospirillum multiglobuliferum TaxID=64969 RepID=A0A1T4RWB8_9GAMM|nr:DUF748 domain-containing protein [Oceanospirillum multiglobuliferum]OPX54563.1 hypothetical protein BTE48_13345 [Oceanospirillum multiglobuliferum]SKA20166.1 protein of unknown function [Oceanospirillum multiglobuliferum]